MGKKCAELLAPAGNYESFLGAIHAGADAVYLGGQKFGARAYAGNFSEEELCRAIRYAHLSDRKVYLTLNTLVKEKEFEELYGYLKPYYEEGLDGIIIQDMGVFSYVREVFPELPLHVSTQAMVTGVEGARFLKEQGAVRIVPARELSLAEIRKMKEETGLELETFIHGAMCYCYSGQCLFSSIAGGRSGNRGRCAQPCRLPYQLRTQSRNCFTKEAYPLSLKDMCMLQDIPALLDAGIDSFKIEGRMKKPEYAAGVTSIYRKYIDAWQEHPERFNVKEEDMRKLSSLYIRSEVQNGYYFRHNGKEMITLDSPAYSGSDEALLQKIRKEFLTPEMRKGVSLYLYCHAGEEMVLTLSCEECSVSVTGPVAENALSRPVTEADLSERIQKFGNTLFQSEDCQIDLAGDCFVSVKALNELRREAVAQLEDAILKQKRTMLKDVVPKERSSCKQYLHRGGYSVLVSDKEQLEACRPYFPSLCRLYIDSDLFLQKDFKLSKEEDLPEIFVALPFVLRARDEEFLAKLYKVFQEKNADGFLVRNVEELGWIQKMGLKQESLAMDAGMYVFNTRALNFYNEVAGTLCLPYELNYPEKRDLMKTNPEAFYEQVLYGRIPMMITANCLSKTAGECKKVSPKMVLTDRYHHEFPVEAVCSHCYNIIWNCLPLSLHGKKDAYEDCMKRLQFTTESGNEVKKILSYHLKNEITFPIGEYTTGHEKRGVE